MSTEQIKGGGRGDGGEKIQRIDVQYPTSDNIDQKRVGAEKILSQGWGRRLKQAGRTRKTVENQSCEAWHELQSKEEVYHQQ